MLLKVKVSLLPKNILLDMRARLSSTIRKMFGWITTNLCCLIIECSHLLILKYHFAHSFFAFLCIHPQPFEGVAGFFKQINNFLEKLITWPRDVGKAIFDCQSSFPSPM